METGEILPLGKTDFRNQNIVFGIKPDDRSRHIYIIGKTGVGKTTLMQNMITHDLNAGRGLCVIDPHNDFAERTIGLIPKRRVNDVVYFNPSDVDYPIAFNIMEGADNDVRKKSIIASSIVGVFKKIFAESWGPRLEYLLRNTILALLDSPGNTLLGIPRLLTDKSFRNKIVRKIKDPVIKMFWEQEFTKYSQSFQVEAISPIQNKIGQFLSSELSRNIFSQVKSSINVKEIMDQKKIMVCNFSKGKMGEDYSEFLGALMITKIQIAAMERADIMEGKRIPFNLYVDEFQNFATESFANILSEARKFKLGLVIAHQYLEQLGDEVRAAVLGNVGTLISFRLGAEDAEELAKEFAPDFGADDLINLEKTEIYIKLMIDGTASKGFSAKTLPPSFKDEDENIEETRNKVIKVSRERYAKRRAEIQEKVAKWMGYNNNSDLKKEEEEKDKKKKDITYNNIDLPKRKGVLKDDDFKKEDKIDLKQDNSLDQVRKSDKNIDEFKDINEMLEKDLEDDLKKESKLKEEDDENIKNDFNFI